MLLCCCLLIVNIFSGMQDSNPTRAAPIRDRYFSTTMQDTWILLMHWWQILYMVSFISMMSISTFTVSSVRRDETPLSQNHRMVWVTRGLKAHLVLTLEKITCRRSRGSVAKIFKSRSGKPHQQICTFSGSRLRAKREALFPLFATSAALKPLPFSSVYL